MSRIKEDKVSAGVWLCFAAWSNWAYLSGGHVPCYDNLVRRSATCRRCVKTLFIEPGSSWENGYVESFNGKLRDEVLNGERWSLR